jgi:hypothetical protein
MTIDRYTKAVLTVIAACLLWMCAMGTGVSVFAQRSEPTTRETGTWSERAQPVIVVGTGSMDEQGRITINMTRRDHIPAHTDPTLPVALPYTPANPLPSQLYFTPRAPLPVEIVSVKKTGDWDPLRASVEDAPVRYKPGLGR